MSEREFQAWQRYAARRMLPQRRHELQLAQLTLIVATAAGAKGKKLSDYLFDPPEEDTDEDDEPDVDAARQFFAFNPRKPKA